jgi:imidazolonepropionase-like amidohydrolase
MLNLEQLTTLPAGQPLAIKNVRLFDGQSDAALEKAGLVVRNGRIEAVGALDQLKIPEDAFVVDADGYTLLPGLMDCHVHTMSNGEPDLEKILTKEFPTFLAIKAGENAGRLLAAGFTTVRDAGADFYIGVGLRKATATGLIPGPHMLVAGSILSITGGHGDLHFCPHIHPETPGVVDGPEEMRKVARTQLKNGVDVIKMCATGGVLSEGDEPGAAQFTIEEMRAAIEEAHKAGKRAAAHAIGTSGIKNAIRAGINTIEHGCLLDDEAIELLLANKVFLVPTLVAPYHIVEVGTQAGIPEYAVEKAKALIERHRESFQKAAKAGVQIAMGTDAGTPFNRHGENALELEFMAELGLSNAATIKATTATAAEALGVSQDRGVLADGKRADLLLVEGDPVSNIRLLQDKSKLNVFKDGRLVASGGKLLRG